MMVIDNYWHLIRNDFYVKQLKTWFEQWNISVSIMDVVPTTGFIIDNVAAMFVYETNSKVCFFDCLICNKEIDKDIRSEALDMLVNYGEKYAKDKGYSYIFSNSHYDAVVKRAENHGFNVDKHDYKVFGKVITK